MHILGVLVVLLMAAALGCLGYCMITHKPIKIFGRELFK